MTFIRTRRAFLRDSAALVAAGSTIPNFLARTALAAGPDVAADERILVVIQLTGGNDGLNTVVPYADDAYHRARPGIGITNKEVLKINNYIGLHPNLAPLKNLFDNGRMSIIQGVGYPNPNRSHF